MFALANTAVIYKQTALIAMPLSCHLKLRGTISVFGVMLWGKSICLAPVYHALCRLAAADALVAEVLLLEGDTS